MKPSFSTIAGLFMVVLLKDLIRLNEAKEQRLKPDISVNGAASDETVNIACTPNLNLKKNASCYLYAGDIGKHISSTRIKTGKSGKSSCVFYITSTELEKHLQSASSREVSCDYTLDSDPTPSPRSEKRLVGVHLTQPRTTEKNNASLPTTSTLGNKEPENRGVPTTRSTPVSGPTVIKIFTSKLPNTTERNKEFNLRTTSTLTTTKPETTGDPTTSSTPASEPIKTDKFNMLVGVVSAMGVILLGVTAVLLYSRQKKRRSTRIQKKPENDPQYCLITMGGNLNISSTPEKDHTYSLVADTPSSCKPPINDLAGSGENAVKPKEDHCYASIDDLACSTMAKNPIYSLLEKH